MALQKSKKTEIIKDLSKVFTDSTSVVFVNFHGINVSDETSLRRDLRGKEVGYKVSRKTFLKRALEGKGYGKVPELPGEIAIAYLPAQAGSKDETITPREIYNFQKTHKGILEILGGIFEGKFISADKMKEIAMIPSREVLLSKLIFLFKSPMQHFALAVSEVAKTRG